jgi:hypothetical protein
VTVSTPSEPTGSPGAEPEAVLVRTSTTDPIAVLGAASIAPDGGPLIAVLATASRERFERRLSEAGHDPGIARVVDFVPRVDPTGATVPSDGGRIHGDIAGLSMELVGRLDGLAGEGGVVYLDSLGPLVSVAGLESTFRFLVIVAARARSAGVPLVARLDPVAVDSVAAETLVEAFDRTVEGTAAEDGAAEDGAAE